MDNKKQNSISNHKRNYILIESQLNSNCDDMNDNDSKFNLDFEEKWNKIESNLQKNMNKRKMHAPSPPLFGSQITSSNNTTFQTNKQIDSNYFDIPNHYTKKTNNDYNQTIQLSHFIHPLDTSFEQFCINQYDKLEQMKTIPYSIQINIEESSELLQIDKLKSIHGLPEYEELSDSNQKKKKEKNIKSFLHKDVSKSITTTNKNYNFTFGDKKEGFMEVLSNEKNYYKDKDRNRSSNIIDNENENKQTANLAYGKNRSQRIVNKKNNKVDYFDQALQDTRKEKKSIKVNNTNYNSKVIQKIDENKKLLNYLFRINQAL